VNGRSPKFAQRRSEPIPPAPSVIKGNVRFIGEAVDHNLSYRPFPDELSLRIERLINS
jgi:hypothetical protein